MHANQAEFVRRQFGGDEDGRVPFKLLLAVMSETRKPHWINGLRYTVALFLVVSVLAIAIGNTPANSQKPVLITAEIKHKLVKKKARNSEGVAGCSKQNSQSRRQNPNHESFSQICDGLRLGKDFAANELLPQQKTGFPKPGVEPSRPQILIDDQHHSAQTKAFFLPLIAFGEGLAGDLSHPPRQRNRFTNGSLIGLGYEPHCATKCPPALRALPLAAAQPFEGAEVRL